MIKNCEIKTKLTIKDSSLSFDILVLLMLIFSLVYSAVFGSFDKESIISKVWILLSII